MHTAIKSFYFAPDGFTVELVKPPDTRDFGKAATGLLAGGYIAPAGAGKAASVAPAPVAATPAAVTPPAAAHEAPQPVVAPVAPVLTDPQPVDLDALRAEATALGLNPDIRWQEKRLVREIEAAKAAK